MATTRTGPQRVPKPTDISQLKSEYLLCRDIRHRWDPYDVIEDKPTITRVLQCDRCMMLKFDVLSRRTFDIIRTYYRPPEGYYLTGVGRGGVDRSKLRKMNGWGKK